MPDCKCAISHSETRLIPCGVPSPGDCVRHASVVSAQIHATSARGAPNSAGPPCLGLDREKHEQPNCYSARRVVLLYFGVKTTSVIGRHLRNRLTGLLQVAVAGIPAPGSLDSTSTHQHHHNTPGSRSRPITTGQRPIGIESTAIDHGRTGAPAHRHSGPGEMDLQERAPD